MIVSTVTSWMSVENTPTVTACSAPAASPSRLGRLEAWSSSFFVMSYLSSYSRSVSLERTSSM